MIVSYDAIKKDGTMKPPYTITGQILSLISSVSEKIGEVHSAHLHRPPPELRRKNRIKTIQSSLEIEGNSLNIDQITSIIENKRVIGPTKEIIEVQNAIKTYGHIDEFDALSLESFCYAHSILMKGLIAFPGKLRSKSVGIVKGSELAHLAPPGEMVKPLMNNLFNYLKNDPDIILIKSCVFHYEMEFIHPFLDGNGRMGRLWQTVMLKDKYPVFEVLSVETLIKQRQNDYYEALGKSDKTGESTAFIEFMLKIINDSLEELLKTQNIAFTNIDRINQFKDLFKNDFFTRKDYLRQFKEISTATASRDLKYAVEKKLLEKYGDKNTTKYKFKK